MHAGECAQDKHTRGCTNAHNSAVAGPQARVCASRRSRRRRGWGFAARRPACGCGGILRLLGKATRERHGRLRALWDERATHGHRQHGVAHGDGGPERKRAKRSPDQFDQRVALRFKKMAVCMEVRRGHIQMLSIELVPELVDTGRRASSFAEMWPNTIRLGPKSEY